MKRVRRSGTRPEMILRRALWQRGLRYRLGPVCGISPDLSFPKERLAVFVDGCLWHGCPFHYTAPRTNIEYWGTKLKSNVERDQRQTRALQDAGWCVVRVWEHEVMGGPIDVVERISRALASGTARDGASYRVIAVKSRGGDDEDAVMIDLCSGTTVTVRRERPVRRPK